MNCDGSNARGEGKEPPGKINVLDLGIQVAGAESCLEGRDHKRSRVRSNI